MIGRTLRRTALLLGVLGAGLSACRTAPSEFGTPAARAPLVACSNMLHPPFSSWADDGRAVGLEVDLVAEAARRLGRSVRWIVLPFTELLPAVVARQADVAASTIGITAERAQVVAFSAPYYETTIVALVRTGEGEPRTLADLGGRRVATERGTTAVGAAVAAIPDARRVLDRPAERSWAELLEAGEVDAIVLDKSHAQTFMEQAGVRFAVLAEPLAQERFALAVHPEAHELAAVLDEVIAEHRRGAAAPDAQEAPRR